MPANDKLVNPATCFPSLHFDMKYATADNITCRVLYPTALRLLHVDAVIMLKKALILPHWLVSRWLFSMLTVLLKLMHCCGKPALTPNMFLMLRSALTIVGGPLLM